MQQQLVQCKKAKSCSCIMGLLIGTIIHNLHIPNLFQLVTSACFKHTKGLEIKDWFFPFNHKREQCSTKLIWALLQAQYQLFDARHPKCDVICLRTTCQEIKMNRQGSLAVMCGHCWKAKSVLSNGAFKLTKNDLGLELPTDRQLVVRAYHSSGHRTRD